MVASTQSLAHPAFAEFIKQMTPDEARIVSSLLHQPNIPLIILRAHIPASGTDYSYWKDPVPEMPDAELQALFGRQAAEGWSQEDWVTILDTRRNSPSARRLITAFQNLARLGLVALEDTKYIENWPVYYEMARSPLVQGLCTAYRAAGRLPSIGRGVVITTEYGRQFLAACVARSPGTA